MLWCIVYESDYNAAGLPSEVKNNRELLALGTRYLFAHFIQEGISFLKLFFAFLKSCCYWQFQVHLNFHGFQKGATLEQVMHK